MELRQLRQFTAVAEHLSFRRAAEHLHMAQPPLSMAVAKLEAELGTRLFRREGRQISLTPAGQAALPLAQQCLALSREIAAAAQRAERGESGSLRVGFVGSATFELLPALLSSFRKRFPAVQVQLHESINMEILAQLQAQQIDVGIVRTPTHRPPAVDFEMLERDTFMAVMRADHPLARRRALTLRTLGEEPLVGYATSRVPGLSHVVTAAFQHAGVMPRIAQEAFQIQTVVSLVESGLGVALVPAAARRHASDQVVFRRISDLPPSAEVGLALACLHDEAKPAVQRLREVARELRRPSGRQAPGQAAAASGRRPA